MVFGLATRRCLEQRRIDKRLQEERLGLWLYIVETINGTQHQFSFLREAKAFQLSRLGATLESYKKQC